MMLSFLTSSPLTFCHRLESIPCKNSKILLQRTDSSNGSLRFQRSRSSAPSHRRVPPNFSGIRSAAEEKSVEVEVRDGSAEGESGIPTSRSFLSVLCPLLKLFGGGDPSQPRNDVLEVATSSLSSLARLPWGSTALPGITEDKELDYPPARLQLFEFEACPFCRRVREATTELNLSIEVYPCPKGSLRHREMVIKIGGKEQFPLLVDPSTGTSLYESGDIVKYLFQIYGNGRKPTFGLLESTLFTGWMPTILRAGRGMTLWDKATKQTPAEKLELFSYENNPFARIVREALCELELPYILRNAGKGSSSQKLLVQTSGSIEVPYLIDPNTGTQLGDYKKIVLYLFQTYSTQN